MSTYRRGRLAVELEAALRPEIAEFLRRYDLPLSAERELEALLHQAGETLESSATLTAVFDRYSGAVLIEERPPAGPLDGRYADLGPLGSGGMGEVRRVYDGLLHRTLAMKLVHPALARDPVAMARFVEEAQATAQLQHPGIVPVHDLGRLADGRAWFTMKEVEGRTLRDVIREVHDASAHSWETSGDGWSLRRLVNALLAACRAVAYAHERGVVHRDLKPENVMVGRHGEVMVLDWGLARVAGRSVAGDHVALPDRSAGDRTRVGQVAGTPAYMPPEQAAGDVEKLGPWSDVYALGAVLYTILGGAPPYEGSARDVLEAVVSGAPEPVQARTTLPVPPELAAACAKAMARVPEERFASAAALADEVQAWLDGSRRRDAALAIVAAADQEVPASEALRARAATLRAESEAALRGVPAWAPEEEKAEGWAKADEAAALDGAATLGSLRREERLRAALTHAPDLSEAHAALITIELQRHESAEAERDDAAAAQARLRMEEHLPSLPVDHPVRARASRWLRGEGALSLLTDPPGADVDLYRYELRNRRLVPVPVGSLGRTPLVAVTLPMGSYLCVLRHPERAEVRYPVHLSRGEHWDGVAPEGGPARPIRMPRPAELGPDDLLVPAGWFWSGDPQAINGLPRRRLWAEALVVRRFPVVNREYIDFLEDLVARGREDEALRHAPRERAGTDREQGPLNYAYDGGRFSLVPDPDGDLWEPDWPVLDVNWWGAGAFAAWEAARTDQPWRLPGELELEKAARGVDGRRFPWGDFVDASWACLSLSHAGRPTPSPVDRYPVDTSVYGVRGVGGGVRVWCADTYRPEGPHPDGVRVLPPVESGDPGAHRVLRGGAWNTNLGHARSGARVWYTPGTVNAALGFRLAHSFDAS